jgi:pimeloyl-ACP methyl ester carboxylesterase
VVARLRALGARPVTLDLRGHGSTPAAPWAWEPAVADVAAVVSALGLTRPVVAGHSTCSRRTGGHGDHWW